MDLLKRISVLPSSNLPTRQFRSFPKPRTLPRTQHSGLVRIVHKNPTTILARTQHSAISTQHLVNATISALSPATGKRSANARAKLLESLPKKAPVAPNFAAPMSIQAPTKCPRPPQPAINLTIAPSHHSLTSPRATHLKKVKNLKNPKTLHLQPPRKIPAAPPK